MSRFGFFLAGFILGAWCAGLAMRWEQLRPEPPYVEDDDGVQPPDPYTDAMTAMQDAYNDWLGAALFGRKS